jgi:hypothetical protein
MIKSTIMQNATEEEKNYLLAFDALMLDSTLQNNLVRAYEAQDLARATKLETISHHAQRRVNRRFNNLFKNELAH